MKTPYLHLYRAMGAAKSRAPWRAVWALRLESCPAERFKTDGETAVLTRRLREGHELLRGLVALRAGEVESGMAGAPSPVFALRYIFWPDAASFTAGRVEVALLAQLALGKKAEAQARAEALFGEVAALLGGAFPDHLWHGANDEAEFDLLWRPLDATHAAEIRRRESNLPLPALAARPALGQDAPGENEGAPVRVVHPFLPHPLGLGQLLRAMLLHRAPLVWQTTVAPAQLTGDETAALRAQIARCERPQFQRQAHGSSLAPALLAPEIATQNAARALDEQFTRLQVAPLLLGVSLWSEQPLPPALAGACGATISAAYGGADDKSDAPTTAGGFRVVLARDAADLRAARRNAAQLDFAFWGEAQWPAELRRLSHLADVEEAAGAFRLPIAPEGGLPGLKVRAARLRPVPREVIAQSRNGAEAGVGSGAEAGVGSGALALGVNRYLGGEQTVALGEADRSQHVYVAGQTGTGKSTLLKSMALADIEAGRGVAVVDPHGDLFEDLLGLIPSHRREDVVVLDPTDTRFPVGLNLLECRDEAERYFLVREMRAMMERLLGDQFDGHAGLMTGPIFYQHMQMNLLLAMSDPDDPGTLLEFYEIFQTKDYWKRWMPLRWSDGRLRNWVKSGLPNSNYRQMGTEGIAFGDYMSSKFEDFLFDPRLRLIFGQKRSSLDLRAIMDEGKILLVNLSKGQLSEANARFLGMILMAKLQAAALSRIDLPLARRRPFSVFVDEFQALATQNFTLLLSEARKFGISLTLANQFVSQIKDPLIAQSIFGNVGTLISFRVGRADAELLAPLFYPQFDADDLVNLPNWSACVKTAAGGQIAAPFSLQTVLPAATPDAQTAREVREISAAFYGRARAQVEAELARSLQPKRAPDPRLQRARQKLVTRLRQRAQERTADNPAPVPLSVPFRVRAKNPRFHAEFAALSKREQRDHPVPAEHEFRLDNAQLPDGERVLRTLDELSEAINLIDPATYQRHVGPDKNHFADWVEEVFGLSDLAQQFRRYPTPLRTMVSIEKFLRAPAPSDLPRHPPRDAPSFAECVEAAAALES